MNKRKEIKLEVKKDRLEINKIIENCFPLIKKNKSFTQECADAIMVYFIEKEKTSKTDKTNVCAKCGKKDNEDLKEGFCYHCNQCWDCLDEECPKDKNSQSKGKKK